MGTRQNNRSIANSITNISFNKQEVLSSINKCDKIKPKKIDITEFGEGNSNTLFLTLLNSGKIWDVDCQKQFQDL